MAEKILTLTLKYKGKDLQKYPSRFQYDFGNKVIIGSDKNLQWQILDETFPKRHNFVIKKGNSFIMNLTKGMKLIVKKDGRNLDENELRNKNLLSENELKLDEDTEGIVTFGQEWAIEYAFEISHKYIPTQEEVAIVKQFTKKPPLTSEQKVNKMFLLIGLFFAVLAMYIAKKTYVPPPTIDFREQFKIAEIATRISPEIIPEKEISVEKREVEPAFDVTRRMARTAEQARQTLAQAQQMAAADFEREFGLDFQNDFTDEDISKQILEITQASEIFAATPGGDLTGSGGGGGGSGPGKGKGSGSGSALDIAGSGGTDISGGGDLGGIGDLGDLDDLGDLSSLEGLDLGAGTGLEEVDLASIGGEIGDIQITEVKTKAQFEKVKKKFVGLKAVKEGTIELVGTAAAGKTGEANIQQIVNTYKPQLTKIYKSESMMMDIYGTITFYIIIETNGSIVAVDYKIADGSYFTNSFMKKACETIKRWKNFKTTQPIQYEFRMTFYKQ